MCVMWAGQHKLDVFYFELPIPQGICANTGKELTEKAVGQFTRRVQAIFWKIP